MAERIYPNTTLFIELAIFLVLFLVLSLFVFKPVMRIIAERRKRIEGAREETERLKEELKILLDQYQKNISEAKQEASKVIRELKKEGDALGKGIVDKARAESEKFFAESRERIQREAEDVKKKLAGAADEISEEIARKILK